VKDDADAIKLMQAEKEAGFKHLYQKYSKMIYYIGLEYFKDDNQAKDFGQDFFASMWENRQKIPIQSSIKNYLSTVARRDCIDILRRQKVLLKDKKAYFFDTPKTTGISELENKELSKALVEALNSLPPEKQKIFLLWYSGRYRNKKISEALGIGIGTIKNQKFRAIQQLQKKMKKYGR